jgi:hypothetical protein
MREGRNLRAQGSTASGLIVGCSALLLILGRETLNLGVLATKEGFVMKLACIELLTDGLQLCTKAKRRLANMLARGSTG